MLCSQDASALFRYRVNTGYCRAEPVMVSLRKASAGDGFSRRLLDGLQDIDISTTTHEAGGDDVALFIALDVFGTQQNTWGTCNLGILIPQR